jgi:hypothetical protein
VVIRFVSRADVKKGMGSSIAAGVMARRTQDSAPLPGGVLMSAAEKLPHV